MPSFTARLENFNTRLWTWHIKVPRDISEAFLEQDIKRLTCTLNGQVTIHCAMMPAGDGQYFIMLNKKVRDQLKLTEGSEVSAEVDADTSAYGLPMPEEFEACLAEDPEGSEWFASLTPGKQRTLIYIVGQVKNPDLRISRGLTILDHLRKHEGKINYKALNTELGSSSRNRR